MSVSKLSVQSSVVGRKVAATVAADAVVAGATAPVGSPGANSPGPVNNTPFPNDGPKLVYYRFSSRHGDLYPQADYDESDSLFRALFRYYLEGSEYSDRYLFGNLETADRNIEENKEFEYPVVLPGGVRMNHSPADDIAADQPGFGRAADRTDGKRQAERFDGVTILFHGLNEKRWDKYLPWAEMLAKKTERPVLLFPMAFHMNRAPASWSEPRKMIPVARERAKLFPELEAGSFVNVALSHRIQFAPHRFLTSGLHSFFDTADLVREIRVGNHPLFAAGASVDLFGYSIGATLVELLLLADPEKLFSDARGFLFCGGSALDLATPVNRTIIDPEAHRELVSFFHRLFENPSSLGEHMFNLMGGYLKEIEWFKSLLFLNRSRSRREQRLREIAHRLGGAMMARDQVFSPESVSATLKGADGSIPVDLRIFDPPYEYSHEDPIPRRVKKTGRADDGSPGTSGTDGINAAEDAFKSNAAEPGVNAAKDFLDTLTEQAAGFFQTV